MFEETRVTRNVVSKTKTLQVSRIPPDVDEEDLKVLFSSYGNVVRVYRGFSKDVLNLHYGFIEFSTVEEAECALEELNDEPPYYLSVEFAKYTKPKKEGQNFKMRGASSIRVTTSGNRREVVLYDQYSERDTYQYNENVFNRSKDYRFTTRENFSDDIIANKAYKNNGLCNMTDDDSLLPTPAPYFRFDKRPFDCARTHCHGHGFCSHCCHSMHSSSDLSAKQRQYCMRQHSCFTSNQMLGVECRNEMQRPKYQKEMIQNKNIPLFSERNSLPIHTSGLDYQSRKHSEYKLCKISYEEKLKAAAENYQVGSLLQKGKGNENVFWIPRNLKKYQYEQNKMPHNVEVKQQYISSENRENADQKQFRAYYQENPFHKNKEKYNERNSDINNRNQNQMRNDHFRKKQVNEDSGHNRRKENEASLKKANFQKQDLDFKEGSSSESVRLLNHMENNNLKINNTGFQSLNINTEIPIYLCYANNPDELWIHKLPETNLEELSKELQMYCEQSEVYLPEVGEICGGLYSVDNTWYRARIEGIDDKGLCDAYFVDYGNSEILSKYHIRQLKNDFLKLPFQAIPCKLVGVKPVGNNWSDEASKMILSTIYSKAKIIRKLKNKYEVELINCKGESMSDLLIKHKYAKPDNNMIVNNLSVKSDKCMILNNNENVSKINLSEKTKHNFGIPSVIEKLPLDIRLEATVVFKSKDGSDFWIHPMVIEVYENFKKLTVLNDYGNNYIENYRPKVNEVVVAQSPVDEMWYRAFVISKNNDEYFVYYLDYGNKEHVKKVAPVLPGYENLPSCIIHCFAKDSCSKKLYTESIVADACLSGKLLSLNEDKVDIEFVFENESVYVSGYPWYYDLEIDDVNTFNSSTVDIEQSFNTISKDVNNEGSEFIIPSGIEVFKPGITLKLQVVYNVTNKDFWVQAVTKEAGDVLTKLVQLNEQTNHCDDCSTELELDKVVIARSAEDGCWYRAYVTGRSSGGYYVRFVDYGNEEEVTKILPIPLNNSLLPSYAFHCIITQQLSEEEERIFNEYFASKLLDVNVLFCDDEKIHMDIVLENCCILLFGYPWYHNLKVNKSLNETADSMIVNDDINEKNEYSLRKENQGFNKIPSAIETVKVGSELHLIVSVCYGNVFSALISEISLFEKIANLEECLHLKNSCSLQPEFKIGDLVTALSPTDNFWYRACIVKSFDDSYLVCFVDYGKHEIVKNIGYLEEKCCSLPSPAIYCNMNAVSAEVKSNLKKLILPNEEIMVILKERIDDNIYLELIDSNSNESICQIIAFPWNYGLSENLNHSPELIFRNDHPKVNDDKRKTENSLESSKTEGKMIEYTKTENYKNNDCENSVLQTVTPVKIYNEQTSAETTVITNNVEVKQNYITAKVASILKTLLPDKLIHINIVVTFPDKLDFWALILDQDIFTSLTEMEGSLKVMQSNNNFNPNIGDIIAAESIADHAWYRACVLGKKDDKVKVRYIDYGNEEYVTTYKPIHDEQLNVISPVMYCMIIQDSKFVDTDKLKELLVVSQSLLAKISQRNSEEVYLTLLTEESEPICDIKALPWYHNLTFLKPCSAASYENSLKTNTSSGHINDSLQIPAIKMYEDMKKLVLSDFHNYEVKVVSVESYEKLFVQPIKFEEEIAELISEITQYCEKLPNKPYDPKINEMVCAKFSEDNLWYRGWVIKSLSSLNYLIQFVDFGNEESVESKCLMPLPDQFASKPICSIQVTVYNLPSLLDISKLYEQLWKMKIVNSQDNIVELLDLDSNNEQLNAQNNNVKTEICDSSSKVTEIFLYDNCEFVNLPLGTVEIIITSIISPETIFCNFVDVNNMSALNKLNEDINLYCSNNAFENYHPKCGELCLAKYSVDNLWYRAVPLVVDEKLQLLFVDYGNIEIVNYEDTRRMTLQFTKIPVQAIHCKLSGLAEQTWSIDVINELLKILPQQCLITVQVLDKIILNNMFIYVIDIPSAREHLLKTGLVKPQAED
ncbi:tudor domain-containing protein 6-like [Centruroides sculpturatus]|uniref:tudor domain-containing protein 6-like n=1 Tax=Centruroides sculpturatus TaxID=218467 RepID=UPI000C6DC83F|nr:tudor domain-containing protein 6-like [Centruroides sculpturatus]